MTAKGEEGRTRWRRRAKLLAGFSVVYNVVEAVIAISAEAIAATPLE